MHHTAAFNYEAWLTDIKKEFPAKEHSVIGSTPIFEQLVFVVVITSSFVCLFINPLKLSGNCVCLPCFDIKSVVLYQ